MSRPPSHRRVRPPRRPPRGDHPAHRDHHDGGGIANNGTGEHPERRHQHLLHPPVQAEGRQRAEELKSEDDIVVQYARALLEPDERVLDQLQPSGRRHRGRDSVTFYNGNGVTPDQSFNCGGDTPGEGVSCIGTYKGGYNTVRGLVALALTDEEQKAGTGFCNLGIGGSISTFYSEVSRDLFSGKVKTNADGTSQIVNYAAGPYRITTPQCHRGAKASSARAR